MEKVPLIVGKHSKFSILPVPLIVAGLTQFSGKLYYIQFALIWANNELEKISLPNTDYKVIAKILPTRFQIVLTDIWLSKRSTYTTK